MADEPVTAWREPWTRRTRRWATRHRTAVTAAGAAVLVALVGTAAVLAVQTRANAELTAANAELAVANAKVTRANTELSASNRRERARFELAQEAIRMFHTGVSEDLLLKQKEFGALRTKLLAGRRTSTASWRGCWEGRRIETRGCALGRAYYEVGELTKELDSKKDALAMYQRALALFEDLATRATDDTELGGEIERTYVAIASSLWSLGKGPKPWRPPGEPARLPRTLAAADPADFGARASWRMSNIFMEFFSVTTLDSARGWRRWSGRGRSRRT